MCLTQTIDDEPDISKPSSSGSSLTEMIVSLPTPPYRTGCRQRVVLHCMPHNTSIASDAPTRKKTYPVGNILALGSSRALRATGAGVAHMPHAALQASMASRPSAPGVSHRENFSATHAHAFVLLPSFCHCGSSAHAAPSASSSSSSAPLSSTSSSLLNAVGPSSPAAP